MNRPTAKARCKRLHKMINGKYKFVRTLPLYIPRDTPTHPIQPNPKTPPSIPPHTNKPAYPHERQRITRIHARPSINSRFRPDETQRIKANARRKTRNNRGQKKWIPLPKKTDRRKGNAKPHAPPRAPE